MSTADTCEIPQEHRVTDDDARALCKRLSTMLHTVYATEHYTRPVSGSGVSTLYAFRRALEHYCTLLEDRNIAALSHSVCPVRERDDGSSEVVGMVRAAHLLRVLLSTYRQGQQRHRPAQVHPTRCKPI